MGVHFCCWVSSAVNLQRHVVNQISNAWLCVCAARRIHTGLDCLCNSAPPASEKREQVSAGVIVCLSPLKGGSARDVLKKL